MTPSGPMRIRPAHPSDARSLYDIAVATGDAGRDARPRMRYPELIGEVFVGPYLAHAQECAFVLADDADRPRGYVLGAADTRAFEQTLEQEWWPGARERAGRCTDPKPDDEYYLRALQHPPGAPDVVVDAYPAHAHIDLLPDAQGGGHGRALMSTVMSALRAAGATGLHLGVDPRNTAAQDFYRHLGFTVVPQPTPTVFLGRHLD